MKLLKRGSDLVIILKTSPKLRLSARMMWTMSRICWGDRPVVVDARSMLPVKSPMLAFEVRPAAAVQAMRYVLLNELMNSHAILFTSLFCLL